MLASRPAAAKTPPRNGACRSRINAHVGRHPGHLLETARSHQLAGNIGSIWRAPASEPVTTSSQKVVPCTDRPGQLSDPAEVNA